MGRLRERSSKEEVKSGILFIELLAEVESGKQTSSSKTEAYKYFMSSTLKEAWRGVQALQNLSDEKYFHTRDGVMLDTEAEKRAAWKCGPIKKLTSTGGWFAYDGAA